MENFVGTLLIEVGKCIIGPIRRQFNSLCCYNTNIQNLRDEAKKLDDAKAGVEGQVAAARWNKKVNVRRVETWLDDVNKIQEDYMSGIEPEIQNVKSGCLAIMSRFSLSRRATKIAEKMKKLQDDCAKPGEMPHSAPPVSMVSIPVGQTYELESRKHFEEGIMATLREKKERRMGIGGMGGVGKTTMAKKIMIRASKVGGEGLFDEIVMVVVSQPVDMLRIQQDIAELLGLRLEGICLAVRAHELRSRLIMNTKSILIILDDLWKRLDLVNLGIPDQRDLEDCTILLTSCNRDVFSAMKVKKTFQMETLEDEEAWSLFKEIVGASVEEPSLLPTAREIVGECKGLPIALVTVGVALKDKTNCIWKDALNDLRRSSPQDIPKFLVKVYNPHKQRYDLLESENAKSIFLMCCLFPEDYDICISDLGLYALGLHMFEGITSLEVARNKVQTLVERLRSRSLLLDGCDGEHTKMHDVVRDVGIFIGAEKRFSDPLIDCTWISLFQQHFAEITFPRASDFPNLRFLLIRGQNEFILIGLKPSLCDSFFEKARELHLLSIQNYEFGSLPDTIQSLKNLRILIFSSCQCLEDISVVGELLSLEILYCHNCSIKELPQEIGRLTKLKLLNISYCTGLETIAAGVISRLIGLKELTLIKSFCKWELGVEEGKNAGLCELNSLSSLTLGTEIEDVSLAAKQIHLSSNLVQFDITIGNPDDNVMFRVPLYGRDMVLRLELERGVFPLSEFLQIDNCRSLHSVFSREMGYDYILRLKSQRISSCSMLKQVMFWDIGQSSHNNCSVTFPELEMLWLYDLPRLTNLCKEIDNTEFPALSWMNIVRCPNLKSPVSRATKHDDDDSLHLFSKQEWSWSSPLPSVHEPTPIPIHDRPQSQSQQGFSHHSPWGFGAAPGVTSTRMDTRLFIEMYLGIMVPQNPVSQIIREIMKGNLELGVGTFNMISEHRIQLCWETFQDMWDENTNDHVVYCTFLEWAANRYGDMLSKWKKRFEVKSIVPNIDVSMWESLVQYWEQGDVRKASKQCRKNWESQLAGEGTGMSCHRSGARFVIERPRNYEIRTGQTVSEWQLALYLHEPKAPEGSYIYGKMENRIHEVEEEAAELLQSQHELSAGENDNDPTAEIDMSQLFVQMTANQKGRKLTPGSSSSSSSVTFSNQAAMVTEIRQWFNQELVNRDAREKQLRNELNQLKMLVEQLIRGNGAGGSNTTSVNGGSVRAIDVRIDNNTNAA